ncbi:MAG TPA: cytochrome c [Telluria sp.]|nr:cytochrome c [Telluria sp.]
MKRWIVAAMLGLGAQAGAQTLDGKAVFAANCAACHQATGAGIPGAFPALKGNRFVQGDPDAVITTVLMGRGGMPTFAESIDDAQLAQVISYIRQGWGNQAEPVSPQAVQAVRHKVNASEVLRPDAPANAH